MSTSWICDLRAPSGYGRASRADLRALLLAEYTPSVRVHQHDSNQIDLSKDPFWGPRYEEVLKTPDEHPAVVVWQETPEFYRPDPTVACVARVEWETSKIIDYDHADDPTHNWVAQFNKMTEIWPASQFTSNVLKSCGVTTPCYPIPHPVDLKLFKPGPKHLIGGGKRPVNQDRFTALSIFQYTARKGPEDLLLAWSRSKLGKREDCALLLKTYAATFDTGRQIMSTIARFRALLNIPGLKQNVYPLTSMVSDIEMGDLYRGADVFITASKAEGFGLPSSESAACGLPSIYADNTSLREFSVGYPVRCIREPVTGMPHIPWYSAEQDWWRVDVLDMVAKLEEAYEDWQTGKIKEIGAKARARVAELHSEERCGQMLRDRIEHLESKFA